MNDPTPAKPLRKRDRLRKIKEAEEAIVACEGAIGRAADDVARAIFERSRRIWQKQLDALLPTTLTALCVRTRVISTGNSYEVLIPLAEISPEGQTYRIIRPDHGNREYVPFHLGIEPYVSEIILMPPGFERYEAYKAHEAASKVKELAILQHVFPESHLDALPFLWNSDYLADKQVTVRIDREGNLLRPVVLRPVISRGVSLG